MSPTEPSTVRSWPERAPGLAISLAAVAVVAGIGRSWTDTGPGSWYDGLDKPAWTPPGVTFGVAWTVLYILMALAAWRILRVGPQRGDVRLALGAYAVQLLLNLGWTAVFFGLELPGVALVEIAVLLGAVVVTTVLFARLDSVAGAMMVPYVLWVSFAALLTLAIAVSN